MADIVTIETRRKAAGISKNLLCRTADIDRGTYRRLQKVKGSGRVETFDRLDKALKALTGTGPGGRAHG